MIFLFTLDYSTLYAVILIWETLKKFIVSLSVLSFLYSLLEIREVKCKKKIKLKIKIKLTNN